MTNTTQQQDEFLSAEEMRELDCVIARMILRAKCDTDEEKIDYITGTLGFSFEEMIEIKLEVEMESEPKGASEFAKEWASSMRMLKQAVKK